MEAIDWHGVTMQPLAGGFSGETFVVGDGSDRVVVRIYKRDPGRAEVDASLLRLVRGLVPVPDVLELRRPTESEPAMLAAEFVSGVRLEDALASGSIDREAAGASVAAVLNTLTGIPFLRFGMFADADLTVAPIAPAADLREWAEHLQPRGRLSTWQPRDWDALLALLDSATDLVEEQAVTDPDRYVLVHSDFNPKNILVDPETGDVVALLDWEFAHAGSPYTDLGNFCRFERDPRLVEPLLAHVSRLPAGGPERLLELGRALDLWALLELAGRPETGPVPELATALLLAQARTGDLHAWPFADLRVGPRAANPA